MKDRHKVRIKKTKKGYQAYVDKLDGFDPHDLTPLWDGHAPFAQRPMSDYMDDAYEKLEQLYYGGVLKGRQREIISLLMDGVFNVTEIAERLGVDRRQVSVHLLRIRKKLE
jgi:DNA-directed RNA polymerase specialized sigma24 family protein